MDELYGVDEDWVDGYGRPTAPPEAIGKNPPIKTCSCSDPGCEFDDLMEFLDNDNPK